MTRRQAYPIDADLLAEVAGTCGAAQAGEIIDLVLGAAMAEITQAAEGVRVDRDLCLAIRLVAERLAAARRRLRCPTT